MDPTPNPNFEINDINMPINIIDYQDFYLIKENKIYRIIIGKNKDEVIIKSNNYLIKLNLTEISILIKTKFNTIYLAYEFLIKLFEENKIIISEIKLKDQFIMMIPDKQIQISLKYYINNSNFIINEINELKNNINILKEENQKLQIEINKLKKYHFNDNPEDIKFLSNITEDSFAADNSDNSFTVFKAINNILYLIYSNENKSIICYDLENEKTIKEIKSNHDEYITNFRHYLDKINKRDLIISISFSINNIQLWNANNWECIINLENINSGGYLYSACFINEKDNIYIITSNCNWRGKCEPIKIYNFFGQKLKEIDNSDENTLFVDIYYEQKSSKKYIITGNRGYVKSYDYDQNKLYYKYCDNDTDNNNSHLSIVIQNDNEIIKLI